MNLCLLKRIRNYAVFIFFLGGAIAFAAPKKIVLIAGPLDDHPPGTHEYENNILLLKHCIESSADFGGAKAEIYFNGWPENPSALNDADTIFITSGGSDRKETDHPLYVGDHFSQLERQMKRGCGLMLYHWTTFHPSRMHDKITEWIGGYFDYETGPDGPTKKWFSKIENHHWTATPVTTTHPVGFGLRAFDLSEEFYFNIRFRENDSRLTPILLKDTIGVSKENVVAWAVEREGGGRGFGFTGGHFYTNWWIPDFRKLLLNAMAWTAKIDVPRNGVDSSLENFDSQASQKNKTNVASALGSPAKNSLPTPARKLLPANPEKDSGKVAKEEAWKDSRLSQTDVGQFLSSSLPTPNGTVLKGISIKIGEHDEAAVCYDTASANLRAAWTGKFLQFDPARFGLIKSPMIAGELKIVVSAENGWNKKTNYRGLYLMVNASCFHMKRTEGQFSNRRGSS
ncbi:MAG: ThuA domain-containing protein [Verrucomicrobiota bacterium]